MPREPAAGTLLLGALAAVALLAGCSPATDPVDPPGSPALALVSPLQQSRSDSDRRVLALPVRNITGATVTVTDLQLDTGRFAGLPPAPRSDPLQPGERVDLRLPYGPATCPGASRPERVVLGLRVGDAPRHIQEVALSSPVQVLDRVHAEECREREVAAAFGTRLEASGPAARVRGVPVLPARLVITRRASDAAVRVVELEGSRLYDLLPVHRAAPLLALGPGQAEAAVPVRVSLAGCQAHVVSQANQVYDFFVNLERDGQPAPERVALPVPPDLQARLAQLPALCTTS